MAQTYPNESTKGEAHKQDVLFITDITTAIESIDLGGNPSAACCHVCPVFADTGIGDNYDKFKNDFRTPFFFFPSVYTVIMELEVYDAPTDTWSFAADLNDNTYGQLLNSFPVADNQKLIAYRLEFQNILLDGALGTGCYRVRFTYNTDQYKYSPTYTLMNYQNELAERTTRMTFTLDRIIGDEDQKLRRNFKGTELEGQIRICDSEFGMPSAEYTTEEVRLENGLEESYEKGFRKKYKWYTGGVTNEVFRYLIHTVFMADKIIIDDYNPDNPSGGHAQIQVEIDKSVDPSYSPEGALVKMEVDFKDAYNNNRKLYA